ncbi:MAG: CehA/McbA family metallohydrolase [Alphaproteobacteria bacterium]|nr:CehA/McbA family metallohydrolase [Alphaproteobacteria bacterium]
MIPSPCEALAYTCDAGSTEVRVLTDPSEVPGGPAALGAPGDVLLANDRIVAVIDALDHPHYLATTGGGLLDLSVRGGSPDTLRQITQTVGLLPDDVARYTHLEIVEDGPVKAVIVSGELDGRPGMRIATRYEIRPCEPGLRIRTELFHGGTDVLTVLLSDGWYHGDRGQFPFTPVPGRGFDQPSFGLTNVSAVLVDTPFLVTGGFPAPGSAYGSVACNRPDQDGFHSIVVSAVGAPTRVLAPGDWEVYERFLVVGGGPDVASVADEALEARRQLFDEPWVTLSGTLQDASGTPTFGWPARALLQIAEGAEGADPSERTPWTEVVPEADGSWSARVPAGRTYTLEVQAFGLPVASVQVEAGQADVAVPALDVPAVGRLRLTSPRGEDVLLFVRPRDEVERDALEARFLGGAETCAPLLGHPHGPSPACDRVLVDGSAPTEVLVPAGTYDLFAVRGPFSGLFEQLDVRLDAGQSVDVAVEVPPGDAILPDGWLSADFHVHGMSSFDSAFPALDQRMALRAADLDVVASTEHDVVANPAFYDGGPVFLTGTEATGHILFDLYADAAFPKVFGHWNLFPLPYDPRGPWRGAPWDELVQPGQLFDRAEAARWDPSTGIAQLNHPWGGFAFGRDYAWGEAIGLDLTKPLPPTYDGSGQSLFLHRPEGARHGNADYHVQEVMNGSSNHLYQQYRAIWFYLLQQGLARGGTANSDTHSLTENVVGFPRTLVRAGAPYAEPAFLAAVRDGRMIGTNGPVIEATLESGGQALEPSLTPVAPAADAVLHVKVQALAWVPVAEVRIVVGGRVVRTLSDLPQPTGLPSTAVHPYLDVKLPLADLLLGAGDTWIVVEAGTPLVPLGDLDCNGVPDTGDTNGDGKVDWRDVDGLEEEPEGDCLEDVGPLVEPTPPARGEPGHAFSVVVPGGLPSAFTNPFLLDRDGGGWAP